MDQHKLRTLVFEKTGVKIDVDDPVFALVALNEAVLEEAVERHVALLNEASSALERRVGALPGMPVAPGATPGEKRGVLLAGAAALLGALLVLAGQALWFKPQPPGAPVVRVQQLSAEQQAAIRNGEKLAKIVEKLDRKTRSAIEAEMQKP
jgi:hypothetical protein